MTPMRKNEPIRGPLERDRSNLIRRPFRDSWTASIEDAGRLFSAGLPSQRCATQSKDPSPLAGYRHDWGVDLIEFADPVNFAVGLNESDPESVRVVAEREGPEQTPGRSRNPWRHHARTVERPAGSRVQVISPDS